MNKGIKLIKRVVALFLVLLLSIENFAAVVSDNDGSAFITKAEFDSLKNSFQSQIDQYNSSIDSKIDGAIASYLAGIRVTKVTNLKSLIENLSDDNKTFRNAIWNNYNNTNTVAGDAGIQIVRMRGFFDFTGTQSVPRYGVFLRILLTGSNDFGIYENYMSNPTFGWWTKVQYDNNLGVYYVPNDYQVRETMHYRATNGFYGSQTINTQPTWDDSLDETNTVLVNNNTSPEPQVKSYYAKIVGEPVYYVATTTATFDDGSASANYVGNLNSQCFNVVPSTNYWFLDGDNLSLFTDAIKFSITKTVYRRNAYVYRRNTDNTTDQLKAWAYNEQPGTLTSYSAKKIQLPLTSIKNHTLSNIVGEAVNLYGGLPMCYLIGKTGKLKFTLSLSQQAVVCIDYGQFGNEVVTADATKYDKNFGSLAAGTHKLEFDMSDEKWNKKDGILWLKVNRTSSSVSSIRVNVTNIVFESE